MGIGEVARRLGVPEHALRHWDALDVVRPDRSPAGHRVYTEEHVARLRVLLACRAIGMGLAETRQVLHRDEAGRTEVIAHHRERLREQRERLEEAEAFLAHVADCRHDLLTRCPDCRRFATTP